MPIAGPRRKKPHPGREHLVRFSDETPPHLPASQRGRYLYAITAGTTSRCGRAMVTGYFVPNTFIVVHAATVVHPNDPLKEQEERAEPVYLILPLRGELSSIHPLISELRTSDLRCLLRSPSLKSAARHAVMRSVQGGARFSRTLQTKVVSCRDTGDFPLMMNRSSVLSAVR